MRNAQRTIVEDVTQSPIFVGTSALEVQITAGVRAVQSTPLFGHEGALIGMLSTHWHVPHRPEQRHLRLLDLLAQETVDIIERARAEDKLRKSEERYRRLVKLAPIPLCYINKNGEFSYLNDRFIQMFGYTHDDVPTLTEWWQLAYPDKNYRHWVIETWESGLWESLETNTDIKSIEYNITCKDGTVRVILISGIIIEDGFLTTFIDITERKQANEALQAMLQRLTVLVSNIHSSILFVGEGGIELVNQAFCDYFGLQYSPADLIGLTPSNLLEKIKNAYLHPEEEVARIQEIIDKDDPVIGEEIAMQGERTCLRDYIPIYIDGKSFARLWHHTDITERKKVEEALRLSEEKFAKAFATNPAAIALTRLEDGLFLEVNDTWVKLNGYSRTEVIGQSARKLPIWPTMEVANRFLQELRDKGSLCGWEQKFLNKSGEIFVTELSAQILTIQGKKVILSTFVDITDRKQAEDLLSKQAVKLQERAFQLEEINKELESFSYSVSHDLQAPLRAIDGFSRKLEREYGDKLDKEAGRLIDVIRSNTKKMGFLINDILSFSRVQKINMIISIIDMDKLVNEVWDEIWALHQERKLRFKATKILPGYGDRALVRQVIYNLLSNAVKFTKNQNLGIIEMSSYKNNTKVVYCLKDNGTGFDMSYYDKLFGVFQRLHSNEEYEGTGIGLAIVQRVVNRHGGRVWAEGEVDKGATFYFTLPATPQN
jgi:PAS domain S-box-containing protein